MKKLVLALALLLSWTAPAVAHAGLYKGYWYGLENDPQMNLKLAALIETALKAHPDGKTMLSVAKCKADGSCGAPINWLESFREHDPEAAAAGRLDNVSMLPAYLRSLERVCGIKGDFAMDRIAFTGGVLGKTDLNGMHRPFNLKGGECAWVDKQTRRVVLAAHCSNPVGFRIDLKCVIDNVPFVNTSERVLTWERTVRPTDTCFAVRWVTTVEKLDDGKDWLPVKPGCIGKVCTFKEFNTLYGYTTKSQGQIELQGGVGFVQVRHAPDEVPAYCVKSVRLNPDGTTYKDPDKQFVVLQSSFTNGTHFPMDFREVAAGQWHSRIFYRLKELPKGVRVNEPKGLLLWVDNQEELNQVTHLYQR